MIASGELYQLNGHTGGELQPLPQFGNQNIRVIAANFGCAYVLVEPTLSTSPEERSRIVWRFDGESTNPEPCPEFDVIDGVIRQISIGEKHVLVLTYDGTVYSRGETVYGSAGHGGARSMPDFKPVPGLKNRKVTFIAAGPHFSIAVTQEGDVYSWGQAFSCESGLFSQVDTVPRFAPAITPFRVTSVSCGHSHVVACTETQQCITWGENTCGQLGVGHKAKPTYKPQLLESIPSQVAVVSAGWAHSVAVGVEGRVYTWGLNSHGQLGLGDTQARWSPNLIHALANTHEIETAHASRAMTIFHASNKKLLMCGQVPCSPGASDASIEFAPRRPGQQDPSGCLLCPVPLVLGSTKGFGTSRSELTSISVFDGGAIGFARSMVYKVSPNVAPMQGGTQVHVYVTGLPFEHPTREHRETGRPLLQELVPVKVRVRSSSPLCDVIVPGKIVDEDVVEFITPDITLSPLGAVVDKPHPHGTSCKVELQVSIDDGLTWTMDRPQKAESRASRNGSERLAQKPQRNATMHALHEFKEEFTKSRHQAAADAAAQEVLWYCKWPSSGPTHLEPTCAPAMTLSLDPPLPPMELLVHADLPSMPSTALTVKFSCKPKYALEDPTVEGPMRADMALLQCKDKQAVAQLPLVGELDVFTCGWLDPAGRGVRCHVPEFNKDHVKYYDYFVELSLDGRSYLGNPLRFDVFDLHVVGLEPNVGPFSEPTKVTIKTTGLVNSDILQVRVDFPESLGHKPRILPVSFDFTEGELTFVMPELELPPPRTTTAATTAGLGAGTAGGDAEADGASAGSAAGGDATAAGEALAPAGGEVDTPGNFFVFVELSLNGQNFTRDRERATNVFNYHGKVQALGPVRLLSGAEGRPAAEPAAPDPKAKGGKAAPPPAGKDSEEWTPGSRIGCELRGATAGVRETAFAKLRVQLMTKIGDEDPQPFKVMDLPAAVEMVESGAPAGDEEMPAPCEMLTATTPSIRAEDLPEGAVLLMQNFQPSLNGQCMLPLVCESPPAPVRLEPKPRETPPES
eukprot:TRINITY_DN46712_c0_g1_i1.p1 TRINITY_DN46712_c0_g1~~TRINITY_DN46712_c0_g1_i1.p1  ORF type:complete len:1025 (+),score=209.02 TRINITY_DN46712_c0_g1_i1:163-3237(+)